MTYQMNGTILGVCRAYSTYSGYATAEQAPRERAHIDGEAKKLLVPEPRKERRGHEAPEHDQAEKANGVVAPRCEKAGRHLSHAIRS